MTPFLSRHAIKSVSGSADNSGMVVSFILLLANVLVPLAAVLLEPKEDARFEGDKLIYRS